MAPICLPEDGPLCAASTSLSVRLCLPGSSRLVISRERAGLRTLELPLVWCSCLRGWVSAHQNGQGLIRKNSWLSEHEGQGFHLQATVNSPFFSVFSQTMATATHSPCTLEDSEGRGSEHSPTPPGGLGHGRRSSSPQA